MFQIVEAARYQSTPLEWGTVRPPTRLDKLDADPVGILHVHEAPALVRAPGRRLNLGDELDALRRELRVEPFEILDEQAEVRGARIRGGWVHRHAVHAPVLED